MREGVYDTVAGALLSYAGPLAAGHTSAVPHDPGSSTDLICVNVGSPATDSCMFPFPHCLVGP